MTAESSLRGHMPSPESTGVLGSGLGDPERLVRLARGEALFHRGDPVRSIFVVRFGRVRLERTLPDGRALTLLTAGPGELFAEAALFSDRYHCDAVAEAASSFAAHASDRVRTMLRDDPGFAELWLRRVTGQVRDLRALLEIRNLRGARQRIEAYLAYAGWRDSGGWRRSLRALAAEVGLAEETVYRTVKALERDGRLGRDGRRLRLLDSPQA